jgi:hypothetical protein
VQDVEGARVPSFKGILAPSTSPGITTVMSH